MGNRYSKKNTQRNVEHDDALACDSHWRYLKRNYLWVTSNASVETINTIVKALLLIDNKPDFLTLDNDDNFLITLLSTATKIDSYEKNNVNNLLTLVYALLKEVDISSIHYNVIKKLAFLCVLNRCPEQTLTDNERKYTSIEQIANILTFLLNKFPSLTEQIKSNQQTEHLVFYNHKLFYVNNLLTLVTHINNQENLLIFTALVAHIAKCAIKDGFNISDIPFVVSIKKQTKKTTFAGILAQQYILWNNTINKKYSTCLNYAIDQIKSFPSQDNLDSIKNTWPLYLSEEDIENIKTQKITEHENELKFILNTNPGQPISNNHDEKKALTVYQNTITNLLSYMRTVTTYRFLMTDFNY